MITDYSFLMSNVLKGALIVINYGNYILFDPKITAQMKTSVGA